MLSEDDPDLRKIDLVEAGTAPVDPEDFRLEAAAGQQRLRFQHFHPSPSTPQRGLACRSWLGREGRRGAGTR
jgi:hypothetical protein